MTAVVWHAGNSRFKRIRVGFRTILVCSSCLVGFSSPVLGDALTPPDDIDLIDMPNARMAPDGQLSIGATFFENTQRYNLGFQATPWLSATFVYSGLDHFDPSFPVYWDRSLQVKARLWDETDIFPAVAIGVNDVVGTAIFGSEYLVASKQFGNIDTTIGIGWGTLGSTGLFRNPLTLISSSFAVRSDDGSPGEVSLSGIFRGPTVGLFGGVVWKTPIDGLSLIAEYSSDEYTREAASGNFTPRDQFNFGVTYKVTDTINVGLDWLYGRSLGANFSFLLDPTKDPYPERLGPTPPEPKIRTPEEQQQALNLLLKSRNDVKSKQSVITAQRRAFAADSAMIDALWLSTGAPNDVEIRGGELSLVISHGVPLIVCRDAATIVGRYNVNIETVTVSAGRRSAHCAVPQSAALLTNSAANSYEPAGTAIALADIRQTASVINARGSTVTDNSTALIRTDAGKQQIIVLAIDLSGSEATVYYSNLRYFSETEALGRLIRVLMADAPPQIEKFRLIASLGGEPQREFDILREPTERSISQVGDLDLAINTTISSPPINNPILLAAERKTYPHFSWSIFPQVHQELFDPSNPFALQFLAAADATVDLLPGLSLTGEGEVSIWDDFNTSRPSDSALPHVRTDFLKYFTQGKNGIGALDAEYRFRIAPNVFAIARAGYLESMFAGAGGEILWRPEGQRWALGIDAYDVWQRDFDRLFGLQPYHVFTGHISLYYASPWYGLNFALRAGQYLAGDRGLTMEVTRRFSTGVEIGVFATRTNVSAAQFGEGSFDKGFMIRIPLGFSLPINTQDQLNMDIRPVQRDGGQRLSGDTTLYDETRRSSLAEITNEP